MCDLELSLSVCDNTQVLQTMQHLLLLNALVKRAYNWLLIHYRCATIEVILSRKGDDFPRALDQHKLYAQLLIGIQTLDTLLHTERVAVNSFPSPYAVRVDVKVSSHYVTRFLLFSKKSSKTDKCN